MSILHLWRKLFQPSPIKKAKPTYQDYWLVMGKSNDQTSMFFHLDYSHRIYDRLFRPICMDILSDFLQPYFCYTYYPKVNEPKFSQNFNWMGAKHMVMNQEKTLITGQYGIDVACVTRFFENRTNDYGIQWIDIYTYPQPLSSSLPATQRELEDNYHPLCQITYQEMDDELFLSVPLEQVEELRKLIQHTCERYGKVLHICVD